jgi:hypothetical protein
MELQIALNQIGESLMIAILAPVVVGMLVMIIRITTGR